MSFPWGAVLDFGGNLLSNYFASDRQEDSQQFAAGQSAQSMAFQERMSNTAVQRHKADLEAAGFNPLLAIAPGGSASTPGGAVGSAGIATPGASPSYSAALASAAQIDVAEAQADKLRAEAEEVRRRTPRHEWDIEEIKSRIPVNQERVKEIQQNIAESAVRIEKIWAEAQTQQATAANIQQHTKNLIEQIPVMRAQVANLKALTAQASAATEETKQRIAANLPAVQAALGNIEAMARKLQLPQQEVQADAADSFLNHFGVYLQKINPLKGLLK